MTADDRIFSHSLIFERSDRNEFVSQTTQLTSMSKSHMKITLIIYELCGTLYLRAETPQNFKKCFLFSKYELNKNEKTVDVFFFDCFFYSDVFSQPNRLISPISSNEADVRLEPGPVPVRITRRKSLSFLSSLNDFDASS